ncbi:MAG: YdjY domain-containing protein [Planctomycetaceae bacterium]
MRIPAAVLLLALAAASPGFAADPAEAAAPPAATPDRHPELKRLAPQEDVWVDVAKKEVVVGCRIAMAEGPIEVFACPEKTKEHEAIVATRSSARIIHAGLLAIGLDPGSPVSFDPVYAAASGPAVAIRMRWKDAAGTPQESRAQDWIRNAETGQTLAADWVFAGSTFWKDPQDGRQYYQADGGDLVCVSNFPTATLDLPLESSQSNEALLFEAFAGRVPPHGTDVEMILSAKP